jgi:hypothetical protein
MAYLQIDGDVKPGPAVSSGRTIPARTWFPNDEPAPVRRETAPLPTVDQHPLSMAWVMQANAREQEAA